MDKLYPNVEYVSEKESKTIVKTENIENLWRWKNFQQKTWKTKQL